MILLCSCIAPAGFIIAVFGVVMCHYEPTSATVFIVVNEGEQRGGTRGNRTRSVRPHLRVVREEDSVSDSGSHPAPRASRAYTPHSKAARARAAQAAAQSAPKRRRSLPEPSRGGVRANNANKRPAERRERHRRVLSAAELAARAERRRIIRVVVLWLIVVAVVVGCIVAAGAVIRQSIDRIDAATSQPNPVDAFREIPCTQDLLRVEAAHTFTYAGAPVDISATITNTGKKRACYIDAGYSSMRVTVISGTETIWDSRACAVGDESLQLLIGPERSGAFAVQWPGKVTGPECTGTAVAKPGMYHAQVYWNDEPLGEKQSFELKQAPPEKDSEKDTEKDTDLE